MERVVAFHIEEVVQHVAEEAARLEPAIGVGDVADQIERDLCRTDQRFAGAALERDQRRLPSRNCVTAEQDRIAKPVA